MSSINRISSDSMSSLFSTLGATSAKGGNTGSILADYASIKNGSYYKLAKKYYENEKANSKDNDSSSDVDTKKELTSIKSSTDDMMSSMDELLKTGSKSLFNKTTSTDEEGNKTSNFDVDKIYNAVNKFAENYNATIKSIENANTSSILSAGVSMVKASAANKGLLAEVGISINKDNSLVVDEEAFKKADMNKVKSLFNGNGSYGYNLKASASYMSLSAKNAANKGTTYSSTGGYNTKDFSSMLDSIV